MGKRQQLARLDPSEIHKLMPTTLNKTLKVSIKWARQRLGFSNDVTTRYRRPGFSPSAHKGKCPLLSKESIRCQHVSCEDHAWVESFAVKRKKRHNIWLARTAEALP
jgi:hypothetical protein